MAKHTSQDTGVRVLARSFQLIDLLAGSNAPEGVTATELSRLAKLPLPSVHRLLGHLAQEGLTFQHPRTRRWYLGLRLTAFGQLALRQFPFVGLAQPVLYDLVKASRETAIFTLRDGDFGVYAAIVESPEKLRLTESIGMRLPLATGASRKVILAFLPERESQDIIARVAQIDPQFIPEQLERECRQIRSLGYAVSYGEVTPHTVGITVPLMTRQTPLGSLMIAGPESRIPSERMPELVRHLLQAVERIQSLF